MQNIKEPVFDGIDDPEVDMYDNTYKAHAERLATIGDNIDSKHFSVLFSHRPELLFVSLASQ